METTQKGSPWQAHNVLCSHRREGTGNANLAKLWLKKDLCFCWNSSTEEPQHRLSTMKVQPSQTPEQQRTGASLNMLGPWRDMKVTGIQEKLLKQSSDAQL